ncbi:late embryogenesis abundant protein Lea5-like [Curcuma longa]|uniref:late embryogenesis abundant protein Lea5-like n=1 Tax=Curcuma longa TaxID=136217 RepID=UPI003D9F3B54
MVRSLSTLSRGIALFFNRRAYSAAALAMLEKRTTVLSTTTSSVVSSTSSSSSNSWMPDPVTGNYRPSDIGAQVDAAELRAMLLSSKQ